MSENKEKKKGFWGTLFSPKPSCGCSCGSSLIEEVPEDEKHVRVRAKQSKIPPF